MKIDLHNHTPRCKHADGELREFVEKAIEYGCEVFGFADHAPMNFDQKYRMEISEVAEYEADVLKLKNEYAGKIEILLGYEVDHLPGYEEERILTSNVDYLIGSVHFLGNFGVDHPESIFEYKKRDVNTIWENYFDTIKEMAKTKRYNIVGHLDLVKIFKYFPNRDITPHIDEALMAIKNSGMAVEINTSGFRKPIEEQYPSVQILKKIREIEIPITFGSDGHIPAQVGLNMDRAIEIAKGVGFETCVYFKNKKMIEVEIG